MKPQWWIVEIILFVVFMSTVIIIFLSIDGKGLQCQVNPIQYGIDKMAEDNDISVTCGCTLGDPRYLPLVYSSTIPG